jgi:hypothetical protein
VEAQDKYYLENSPTFLDQPGEWCYDRNAETLYYLPRDGETIGSAVVVVPNHPHVLRLEGNPEAGKFIEHLTFRGVTFAHSEWYPPDPKPAAAGGELPRGGFSQAAIGVPAVVAGVGLRNCAFEHCTFADAGNYGLELGRGCRDNRVSYCTFRNLGAGGVKVGETQARPQENEHTRRNVVSDCEIADCGRLFHSAVGVWVGQSYDNTFAHNHVHGLHYTGFSVGWTWGYGPALTRGNVIESNHVHHVGTPADGAEPVLSDMGGIYTLGPQPGTVIRGNKFHDIKGVKYGGWGIYFDEGSSQIVAENNLVYRTTHGGFHQHYGRDNVVQNNVFAYAETRQVERSRSEPHRSFTFERNVVLWDSGQCVMGNWDNFNTAFDRNVYWPHGTAQRLWAYRSWDDWRAQGMDKNSVIADPGFVDPGKGDFTLKAGSPGGEALKGVGFVLPDWSGVGPRPLAPSRDGKSGK